MLEITWTFVSSITKSPNQHSVDHAEDHLDICVIDPDQFISRFKGSFLGSWGVVKHLQFMINSEKVSVVMIYNMLTDINV